MRTSPEVRRAALADCPGILAIYNDAVLHTTATYDYEPRSLEHRQQWFTARERDRFPIFVAVEAQPSGPERIIGWSALNPYHDRMGYRFTSENSVYVAANSRNRGVGSLLLAPLIPAAEQRGLHAIIAVIDATNAVSIRLHAKFGFEQVGHFKRVGFKFGRWLDVVYMERLVQVPVTD
ncbi:MAG TPA: N-acetyltransferase family protein [Verrucomicrobiota bacterium]|nr:N-acetyltransferase family protein [Verrucomicrobiota bacterium]